MVFIEALKLFILLAKYYSLVVVSKEFNIFSDFYFPLELMMINITNLSNWLKINLK